MASLKRPITAPVVRGEEWKMARRRPMVRATGSRRAERNAEAEPEQPEKPKQEKQETKKSDRIVKDAPKKAAGK
jgi:hypothetical protein